LREWSWGWCREVESIFKLVEDVDVEQKGRGKPGLTI